MCMLSLLLPGAEIDSEHLLNGAKANTDGYGWAMVFGGDRDHRNLIVSKSMNRFEALDKFADARKLHPESYAMFHSRWSTGGTRTVDNCHPYQVGGDPQTVLGHNGVLFSVRAGETRSDTRVFAEEIFPKRYRRLDRKGVAGQIRKYLGSNKVAILTANPRYRHPAYLFGDDYGYWVGDTWHSNTDYLGRRTYTYAGSGSTLWDDEWDDAGWDSYTSPTTGKTWRWRRPELTDKDCAVCLTIGAIDRASGLCEVCMCCGTCQEWYMDCDCLTSGFVADDEPKTMLALPAGSGSSTKYGDAGDEDLATLAHEARETVKNGWPEPGVLRGSIVSSLMVLGKARDDKRAEVVDHPGCMVNPVSGECMEDECPVRDAKRLTALDR